MDVDNNNTIHFTLGELNCICSLISMFDINLSNRLFDIYSYHKCRLHENDLQPLQLTLDEIKKNYKKKFIFNASYQPEFIFSDDEDIF